ncbi:hypothetical protein OSB04_029784 [Centaurea solstitialis]|uniref:Receptor-like serine/threonine-protein kinase n=1 Tax=Centaurea solstitialis TaxID=347529 RepID=A0AA38W6I0_9ASTR|nr:hypothetical protein OSB04_029784 [Centaurea solstitialis]
MASVLRIFLSFFFLLVIEGSGLNDSTSGDISLGESLTPDGKFSWPSPSGLFAFGFYKQDDGFAVGIWLTSKPLTVVWTANRDDPPVSSSSTIELNRDGWLLLRTTNGEAKPITDQNDSATSAFMHNSGNFALYNQSGVIWESFAYPCDTILGGQNLTVEKQLVSSFSDSQHSSGRFSLNMQSDGNLVAYAENSARWPEDSYWSSATFGMRYDQLNLDQTGSLNIVGDRVAPWVLSSSSTKSQPGKDETLIFRAILTPEGNFILYSHRFTTSSGIETGINSEWLALQDPCKAKGVCGVNSYCSRTDGDAKCVCFPDFLFFDSTRDGKFLGCYRNFTNEEACSRRGLELSYNITAVENIEFQALFSYSMVNIISKEACSKFCLDDCNCWASYYTYYSCTVLKVPIIYASLDESISATVFIKTSFPNDKVKDPQRSVPATDKAPQSPLPALTNDNGNSTDEQKATAERKNVLSVLSITLGLLALMCTLMAVSSFFVHRVHAHRYQSISENVGFGLFRDHFNLRSFSFDELQKATDGFKEVIGRNSYGEVYKGFISEGKRAVAVKRLESLVEGAGGFRAEITAIAQTHHRNLVRLLGFCIQGGATKLLVYEFMSNGSLADLLSNAERQCGWKERFRMAVDVARGILYLHEECEARIIHCNIKPHNILFDESWTAKISDFGLSKLLRPTQSGSLTGLGGTRGYMAPEWHKNTLISTKVDIYSFGVVLLEILCCTSDAEIDISSDDKIPFYTWVYSCFEGKELSRLIGDDDDDDEVDIQTLEKMVKVGLLCIQDDPDARPSIKSVILMLEGTTDIPIPPSPIPYLI